MIGREAIRSMLGAVAVAAATLGLPSPASAGGGYLLDPVGHFTWPVHVEDAPGAPRLLFVVEQKGVIRVLRDGQELKRPFLDIRERVTFGGEQGLLSIAFHPNYERNRRFYAFYVNRDGGGGAADPGHDVQVDQFKSRKDSRVRAAAGSRRKTIAVQHDQGSNHVGGQLQFKPGTNDLYVSIGDGGSQRDPEDDAQSPDSPLGKILRITPRGKGGYTVPGDNPHVGAEGEDEIYAVGLRNPFRFSFDSLTGALAIGDVGGGDWEEVSYVADPQPGLNFGWNDFEGTHETPFGIGANASPHTPPIHEYPHDDEVCAVIAGYVVRDPELPDLAGQYLFADLCEGSLRTIQVPSGAPGTPVGLNADSPSTFGEGAGGQIYVTDYYEGTVFALEPAS